MGYGLTYLAAQGNFVRYLNLKNGTLVGGNATEILRAFEWTVEEKVGHDKCYPAIN